MVPQPPIHRNKAVSVLIGVHSGIYVVAIFFIIRIISSLFDASTERLIASHHPVTMLLRLTDLVADYRHLIIFLMRICIILVLLIIPFQLLF